MLYRIGCAILALGVPAFAWERLNNQVGYLGAALIVMGFLASMYGSNIRGR